jgi:hypothetical protein
MKMQIKFEYGCGPLIIGEVIALGLRKLHENESFCTCTFSKSWFDKFKLYLVYGCIMKGCRLSSNMGAVRLLLEEVAFSYIFNFLGTAEMISLNLGRNEVLMIPYKCCCISK